MLHIYNELVLGTFGLLRRQLVLHSLNFHYKLIMVSHIILNTKIELNFERHFRYIGQQGRDSRTETESHSFRR